LGIRMQITLGGDQRAMTGDLAEHVNRNACVGHPGQAGVAQVVTTKVLVTEGGYHLVPSKSAQPRLLPVRKRCDRCPSGHGNPQWFPGGNRLA